MCYQRTDSQFLALIVLRLIDSKGIGRGKQVDQQDCKHNQIISYIFLERDRIQLYRSEATNFMPSNKVGTTVESR